MKAVPSSVLQRYQMGRASECQCPHSKSRREAGALSNHDSRDSSSSLSPLSKKEVISADDLKNISCILVVSKDREDSEREFFEKSLNLSHRFLYADSLEQARLMVASQRGYLPVDQIGHLDKPMSGIERIELSYKGNPIQRNYFACWPKDKTNYYIEEFVKMYKEALNK